VTTSVRFGPFELNPRSGELRRDGVPVKLQPQPAKVLALLVERPGELVLREEIKKALWGEETYVDFERGLNFCILQVRTALGDSSEHPRYIETLPRRGYRFIAPLKSQGSPRGTLGEPWGTPATSRTGSAKATVKEPGRSRSTLLRAIAISAVVVAALAGGAFYVSRYPSAPAPAGRVMVAVLPFDDLSGEQPAYLADGLTEELIVQLGRVSPRQMGVIARTSAMTYRGASKSVAEIGRELGVSHVIEGSVRRQGDRVRISTQLVAVADQSQVWSDTFDRDASGALSLQNEVAARVTRALALELVPAASTIPAPTATTQVAARDAYLRGRHFANRGLPGDLRTALQHFEEATRIDSSFAAALAAQADTYHLLAMFGQMPASEAYARAAERARDAIRLEPNLADAHAAAGLVHFWGEWQPARAAAAFERAIDLNPSDASAHHDYAWSLVALQRFDEAVTHVTRARELDPLSVRASSDVGWLYLQIRQPTEAARACEHTLRIDPDSIEAQQCLERAHLQRGRHLEALAAARAGFERTRGPVPAVLETTDSPAEQLMRIWKWRIERLESLSRERYVNPYTLAMHYVVVGDHERALASLEQAYESRAAVMVLLPSDPVFDALRPHPRFRRLIAQITGRAG
jgi:TolB-like protein/DNA-binding winged helix-turn-helix (wHTH) protein